MSQQNICQRTYHNTGGQFFFFLAHAEGLRGGGLSTGIILLILHIKGGEGGVIAKGGVKALLQKLLRKKGKKGVWTSVAWGGERGG